MTKTQWHIAIFIIWLLCLPNIGSHPATLKHNNTTTTIKMQSLKQKGDPTEKPRRIEVAIASKVKMERRQIKKKTTAESKVKEYKSMKIETIEEKIKKEPETELKSRRQLKTKPTEGYMPICGIDSYEDDIFGCIELESLEIKKTTAAVTLNVTAVNAVNTVNAVKAVNVTKI